MLSYPQAFFYVRTEIWACEGSDGERYVMLHYATLRYVVRANERTSDDHSGTVQRKRGLWWVADGFALYKFVTCVF